MKFLSLTAENKYYLRNNSTAVTYVVKFTNTISLRVSHKAVSQSVPRAQVKSFCQSVKMLAQLLLERLLLSILSGHRSVGQNVNK